MVDPSNMPVATPGTVTAAILAQEQVAVGAQLEYFQSVLLSASGLTALVLGAVALGIAFSLRQRLMVLAGSTMFLLTMMLHESTAAKNMLVGPLQLLRNISRPIAFALIGCTALAAFITPKGARRRATSVTAVLFLGFQLFYALQYMLFIDPLKGVLAVGSMTAMFLVCTMGLGRMMQDVESAAKTLQIYLWVAVAFVGTNLLQLAIGPSAAVLGGRLAGIAGNAQQMGAVSALLLIVNAYLFGAIPAGRVTKWICLAMIGFLGLFILWSGSRASALAAAIGLVFMYRLQLGRFALLVIAGGIVLALSTYFFEDSTANASRFVEGGNTRAAVFAVAIDDFLSSPVFGVMPRGFENGVESSYLRALASMGIIGGLVVLVPFASMGVDILRAVRLDVRGNDGLTRLRDFFIGVSTCLVAVNVFEGFAFGVLTFPAMFMYSSFAVGSFLDDQVTMSSDPEELPYGGAGAEPNYL